MLEWIQNLMQHLGYGGIFLLMVLENVFPPVPAEVIMPAAGFAAARGELHLLLAIVAGTAGSVVGTLPLYFLGRLVGEVRLAAWADRYGRWLTLSSRDIQQADDWFDRHGHKAVLFGRLLPGIRSLLSIPAGLSEMPLGKFLLYTALGSGLWTTVNAGGGYLLGENFERVQHLIGPIGSVVVVALVVWAGVWFARRLQERRAPLSQKPPSRPRQRSRKAR
ncbi:DedA family protein [Deinococcus maricopensis]|uniref:SNARE associated Golgi protein-like protein n=1 Tax=Deinococcus maricopensis (strain DSM 21211 / LMG 22137 / NRRL B-23946 / LB-34) TaxID=709986 RepID=E8U4W7_DEIML|nr:DedA family protein [Deinococcus maricopensis]ADV66106.1 SNARE associated Golgi protein-like protein [Deinococcus maricopensis DSM 21211]